ncbi:nucleotidyltransferase domain-containing protein [Lysinibacillus sp. SGAir0095]|uniref:nucleotidyltransferase domain-containing protein n=1 Tax=Lysinibacillus sp. SGAir0095 TaxID=2070463 RepID=UPI0010CD5F13|nr:nucleotidyltransferase domain-containing protein [Lysinibacillus sp. SGAir0095]QCR30822.1 nucleotidyltransferase domain-containing protein [Lysinibacillus sp. SGAir0095]
MSNQNRIEPFVAAKLFVDKYYLNCQGALLAGSVVRGEATDTSDLDIVIFDAQILNSFRQSIIDFDWPIEVFVHNLSSYKPFFEADYQRARPSLPRMISEGIIIKNLGVIEKIKDEANGILCGGPEEWPLEVIQSKRYFMTDALEDFIGSTNRAEELMIANTLSDLIQEFVLRSNGRWIGSSKWIIRELNLFDADFTRQFTDAFETFYKHGDKSKVIELVEQILSPYGGRLFAGFRLDSN